ncbi:caspase family protein [Streptomyces diastatochromogenes]|nr:caspase family protein [Streptomyces diastatochromogenes]
MTLPDPEASRAVLIGVDRYQSLPSLRPVGRGRDRLAGLLQDPAIWGLPARNIKVFGAQATRDEILTAVKEAARATTDTVLVYFAGHGLRDRAGQQLHLALASADDEHPQIGSISYTDIRQILTAGHRARRRIVLLDCCYSGLAGSMGNQRTVILPDLADQDAIEGTYLLTSASSTQRAFAHDDQLYPEFTGVLTDILKRGIPHAGPELTLNTIWRTSRSALVRRGSPEPQQFGQNALGDLAWVKNAAHGTTATRPGSLRHPERQAAPPTPRRHLLRRYAQVLATPLVVLALATPVFPPQSGRHADGATPPSRPQATTSATPAALTPPTTPFAPPTGTSPSAASSPSKERTPTPPPTATTTTEPAADAATAPGDSTQGIRFTLARTFTAPTGWLDAFAFSSDGTLLAAAVDNGEIRLWNTTTGDLVHVLTGHQKEVMDLAFVPGGKLLASASRDGTVRLWNTGTGKQERTLTGHSGEVYSLDVSPQGGKLVTGGQDNTVRVWSTGTGELLNQFTDQRDDILAVAFSPDGDSVAAGSYNHSVYVYDLGQVWTWEQPKASSSAITTLAYAPDSTLAAAGYDKNIQVWDPETSEKETLKGHTEPVNSIAFNPAGTLLASAAADSVRVWDLAENRMVGEITDADYALQVEFGPDGKTLATSNEGSISFWNILG